MEAEIMRGRLLYFLRPGKTIHRQKFHSKMLLIFQKFLIF